MDDLTASRTLVKSPPELWAECSDAGALGRHLGDFGEIRITRSEPESTVAWEGEQASGTVQIDPSGWGTRVTLTVASATVDEPAAATEDQDPPAQGGRLARLLRRRRSRPVLLPAPVAASAPQSGPEASAPRDSGALDSLQSALDSLGAAHHRPFSRG